MRIPEKRCPLVRMSGRMGQSVWRTIYFVFFPSQWCVLKSDLKQTLCVFNDGEDPLFFVGQGDIRGQNV